jgi:2'-5' RNA ligase
VVVGRLFVAVALPDEARYGLAASLDVRGLPGKVVAPANWHVTLRFLGDVDDVGYDRLLAALDQSDLGGAFDVTLDGLGAFPRPNRATVLWIGFGRGGDALERLAAAVEEEVEQAGFPAEERPFHSHLTLSRIRPHQDVRAVIERADRYDIGWMVDEIVVFRSHLGRGGPRYEDLARFPLRNP